MPNVGFFGFAVLPAYVDVIVSATESVHTNCEDCSQTLAPGEKAGGVEEGLAHLAGQSGLRPSASSADVMAYSSPSLKGHSPKDTSLIRTE